VAVTVASTSVMAVEEWLRELDTGAWTHVKPARASGERYAAAR
jgi:hypothetical protein